MKVTVSADEPLILRDAQASDLFLIHAPHLDECVFAPLKARSLTAQPEHQVVVCVGCRVGATDRGFLAVGSAISVHLDSPITLLNQVEPAAFRSRAIGVSPSHPAPTPTGPQAQPEPISRL